MKPADALQSFAFFRALSDAAQVYLTDHALVRMVGPRTPLLERGTDAAGVFLVTHGALRVYYIHPNGREGTLYWVEPRQACFLSLDCAFKEIPFPAWAQCDDLPTQFVTIPAELFRKLHASEPAIQHFTYEALSSRVYELMNLVEQSATLALEQRVAVLLLRLADDEGKVRLSQERLASHLGTAREVLVRILRDFRNRRLIQTARGSVTIEDAKGLAEAAENGDVSTSDQA